MPDGLTIVGTTKSGEAIYAAAPGNLCPCCGDQLFEMPDGQRMCAWCDILVSDETELEDSGYAHE